jgi:peptide/nickel transport system ATP-binding protein
LCGESGSGKSVTSLGTHGIGSLSGKNYRGRNLLSSGKRSVNASSRFIIYSPGRIALLSRGEMAMIFQEPMSSLNPVYNIEFQITEAILLHQKVTPNRQKIKQSLYCKKCAYYPVMNS